MKYKIMGSYAKWVGRKGLTLRKSSFPVRRKAMVAKCFLALRDAISEKAAQRGLTPEALADILASDA